MVNSLVHHSSYLANEILNVGMDMFRTTGHLQTLQKTHSHRTYTYTTILYLQVYTTYTMSSSPFGVTMKSAQLYTFDKNYKNKIKICKIYHI